MRFTLETDQIAVIDDFLSPDQHQTVWNYMTAEQYTQMNVINWAGAWRLDDGQAMRGPGTSYGDFQGSAYRYPSKTGIDILIETMVTNAQSFERWIGRKDKDWIVFTAAPIVYPRKSGLYWHRDATSWTGSYTYYAHREWNIQWGGELLVADSSTQSIPDSHGAFMKSPQELYGAPNGQKFSYGAHFDNSEANKTILESGVGTYVMPKPNRLVIIKERNPHCVTKVDDAAGDHVRASISGFFLKPGFDKSQTP